MQTMAIFGIVVLAVFLLGGVVAALMLFPGLLAIHENAIPVNAPSSGSSR